MSALIVIAWILLAFCALILLYWSVVWLRVSRVMRDRPTVRAGLAMPEPEGGWPKVSVVIPAHNEEQVIDRCCRSLREQDYPREKLEIIFVLDRCTDRTAEIVRRHAAEDDRVFVIENDSCPADWAGKCNAARLGADRAGGAFLIFTDADTEFDPALSRAAVAIAKADGLALLSLLTSLRFTRRFEKIVQPVATMNLLGLFPPRKRRNTATGDAFANGQFMLFSREWYETIGGHEAVKSALLEDLAFARCVHRHGGESRVLLSEGMIMCAMYESLDEFRSGWKRILIEACHHDPPTLRKHGRRVFASGVGLLLVQVAALVVAGALYARGEVVLATALAAAVGLNCTAQGVTLRRIYTIGGAPGSAVIYYPFGCWIVAGIFSEAAQDIDQGKPIRWGGREYIIEPRIPRAQPDNLDLRSVQ